MPETNAVEDAVVRRSVTVPPDARRAFELFTTRMDAWWPREHHIGATDIAEAVVEPRSGGRWYERDVDGSECEWGRVVEWDPPRRLVLMWQIGVDWHYDPDLETEVHVTFEEQTRGHTRVELAHRHLERYGEQAEEMRRMFESPGAWGATLERYAAVAGAAG